MAKIRFYLNNGTKDGVTKEWDDVIASERSGYWVVERVREMSELVVTSVKDSDIVAIVPNDNLLWMEWL